MQLPMQLWHSHFLICGNDCPCVPTKKYNQKKNEHGTIRYHHCIIFQHLSYWYIWVVSKNRGTPKWMIYMEIPIKMDDLGVPPFLETPIYIYISSCYQNEFNVILSSSFSTKIHQAFEVKVNQIFGPFPDSICF